MKIHVDKNVVIQWIAEDSLGHKGRQKNLPFSTKDSSGIIEIIS